MAIVLLQYQFKCHINSVSFSFQMPYLGRELPQGRSRGENIRPVEQALPFMCQTLRPSYGVQNSEYLAQFQPTAHQQPIIAPKRESPKNGLFELVVFQSPYRTVLKDTAIPTIFDLTSHLRNPHTRHRKRIKELVRNVFIRSFRSSSTVVFTVPLKLNSLFL